MSGPSTALSTGRVKLIGEHTDYNGGLALPFEIERGVTVRARPSEDGRFRARALDLGEEDEVGPEPGGTSGWRAVLRGTVARLWAAPAELEITGDVPRGSGLSSSAALGVAL